MKFIIIVSLIFLPNKSFEFYYIINSLLIVIDLFFQKKLKFKKIDFLFLFLFLIPFIRSLFYFGFDDLKESYKFLFFLLVSLWSVRINFKQLIHVLKYYIIFNFIVSTSQFFKISEPINLFIAKYFNADSQFVALTWDSVRALGLSSGPGQHGVYMFMLYVLFSNLFLSNKNKFDFALWLLVILPLLFSQSKTVFIVFVLFSIYKLFFYKGLKNKLILASIFSPFIFISSYVLIYFNQYKDLFLNVFSVSSFQARIDKWNDFISIMLENPFNLIFGSGRNFIAKSNLNPSAFDSDYVYMFINFGIIGLIIIIIVSCLVLYTYRKKIIVFELILFGLICGFALNYFIDIKAMVLILLIVFSLKKYDRKNSLDISKL